MLKLCLNILLCMRTNINNIVIIVVMVIVSLIVIIAIVMNMGMVIVMVINMGIKRIYKLIHYRIGKIDNSIVCSKTTTKNKQITNNIINKINQITISLIVIVIVIECHH